MKLLIEVEDVGDKAAWVRAMRELYTACADQHGYHEAFRLWEGSHDLKRDRARAFYRAEKEFDHAFYSLSPKERLLVLDYYDNPQSKRGHGKAFAAKNNTKATSGIRQTHRVFSEHPEACRIIGEATPERRMRARTWLSIRLPRVTKPRV